MSVDGGSVEKTATMISAIINQPTMTPKLLQRPPFRFLHEVMFNIIAKTGFAKDSFDTEEKDCKAMCKVRGTKCWAVLQKLIKITGGALGIDIDVSPATVTAGKECAKTRQFLQYFCIAATSSKVRIARLHVGLH